MKQQITLLLAALLVCVSAPAVQAAEKSAQPLAADMQIAGRDTAALRDGSVATAYTPDAGDQLKISAKTPIRAVYLQFAQPPAPYTLTADGKKPVEVGKHAYLHELVSLDAGAKSLTVQLPPVPLVEITVYSDGALPPQVQQWQPPASACDLLAFPSHADDDTLYMGAAIADAVARGKQVQIAYLAHHAGEPVRSHELLDGLWELGVTAYPVIGKVADIPSRGIEQALEVYDESYILNYEVWMIRRFRPSVVLGHDVNGEYGHGLHMLGARKLQEAVRQSADPQSFPESAERYGVWQPAKTYLHLYPENPLLLAVDAPLAAFGGRTAFQVAQDAFARHPSQHQWDLAVSKTNPAADCRAWGLYHSTVGADTGANDLFENLPSPKKNKSK